MNRNKLMTIAVLTAITINVQAKTPQTLDDLVDMRASSGERELEDRGYRHHKTMKIRDSSIGYWWNSRKGRCIAATTKDGRFASIVKQPESMCDKDGHASNHDHKSKHHHGGNHNFDDLEGMRAKDGKQKLADRGYHHRNTIKVRDKSITYWWNPKKRRCIAVTIKHGKHNRYSSFMDQPKAMCDK